MEYGEHHPLSISPCSKLDPPLHEPFINSQLSYLWPVSLISLLSMSALRIVRWRVDLSCFHQNQAQGAVASQQPRKLWCHWLHKRHLWLRQILKNQCLKERPVARRYPKNQSVHPWASDPKTKCPNSTSKVAVNLSRSVVARVRRSKSTRPLSSIVKWPKRIGLVVNRI